MASSDKIEAFLAERRNAVVAGIRRDGRAIREKYGMTVPGDEQHLQALVAEGRVLLAFTPDQPLADWTCWGLD